jgi:glycosyltransferase involved in cell wall biosynthesis
MRHAAIYCAEKTREALDNGHKFDVVLCTDMLNLAEYCGLVPDAVRKLPQVIYFHENQFSYPSQNPQERDFHFSFTNLISTIAADEAWFNSQFNLDSMSSELKARTKTFPDFVPKQAINSMASKMIVAEPGIQLADHDIPNEKDATSSIDRPLRIVWAARWEHDKNPADLLFALRLLKKANIPFQISVIGQRYTRCPKEFDIIESEFSDEIWRWGYQPSREAYWETLRESDVFLSTATHEFFGLSALEAMSVGCFPLLPNRLAYPEVISKLGADADQHLYNRVDEDLVSRVKALDARTIKPSCQSIIDATRNRFGWPTRAKEMDQGLCRVESREG